MTDDDVEIRRTESADGGRYEATLAGAGKVGELTYGLDGPDGDILVARHTEVRPSMRERGIAGRLVGQLVADARAEGRKVVPRCAYVRAQFDRHPDWQDLLL